MKSEECYHPPTTLHPKAVYKNVLNKNVISIPNSMGGFPWELSDSKTMVEVPHSKLQLMLKLSHLY